MTQLQPPLDEQGEAHDALASAVANYGPRILQNPQILGNVVTDLLPDLPREQNLLIAAAEADVATDLSQHIRDRNLDPGTAVQLTAHALADKKSIDPAASMWVTTEYAKAMGYNVPAYVPQSTPVPSAPPVLPSSPYSVPPLPRSVPPSAAQSVPPPAAQSVPPPAAQSVPPPAAQSVPQSVPPSVPPGPASPWQSAPQAPPSPAQPSVPPAGGYGGGAPAGPWTYGPSGPGGPHMPPDNSRKNRGLLIAAISAAAVVVIVIVAVVATGAFKPAPVPSPTHTSQSPSPPPASPSVTPTSPSATPSSSGPTNQQVAAAIANIAVGQTAPGPLQGPDGTATQATCDPSTVSNPPDPNTPSSASCDITYSDGTIWRQTVTIDFDSAGDPVHASTNAGTQIG